MTREKLGQRGSWSKQTERRFSRRRVEAYGEVTKRNAGTLTCCCEYSEILGLARRTCGTRSQPRSTSQIHPNVEPKGGGWTDNDEIQERGKRQTHPHHEEDGVRVPSGNGVCKGCLMIGQPNTKECRARITTPHTRRDSKKTRPGEWSSPIQSWRLHRRVRAEPTRRNVHVMTMFGPPQESAITGESSSRASGNDMEMRSTISGKRPLEPGDDDDMVCGLGDPYVNDFEGDYTDEMTGATLLRDDVGKARAEEMAWYHKFEACAEVTEKTCQSTAGRKPISCRWKGIDKGGSDHVEVRSRLIARDIKQKGTDSHFAGTPPLALVRYVISRPVTKLKTGRRRQLMVYDAKRAFLHIDAVTGTYVKPPQQRDTERCWLLKKCMYGRVPAAAGWQHLGQKVGALS